MKSQNYSFLYRVFALLLCMTLTVSMFFRPIKSKAFVPAIPGAVVLVAKPVGYYVATMGVLNLIDAAGGAFESIFGSSVYEFWKENFTDEDSYRGFTSTLDHTTVNSNGLFTLKPMAHWLSGSSIFNQSDFTDVPGGFEFSGYAYGTQTSYNRGSFTASSQDYIYIPPGVYKATLTRDGYWGEERYTPSPRLYLYPADGGSSITVYDGNQVTLTSGYYSANLGVYYTYWVDGGWYKGNYYDVSANFSLECLDLRDSAGVVAPDHTTRPTSVMDVISKWNKDNSIGTNPININYYISPTGQDVTSDTLSNPSLYDEETMVFTDPVTGNQYLTSGWTYDYLTRCYTLTMADTFTIGESVIDTIKLTYGDEKLTIDHYSNGSLVQSDSYDYVMVSGSECSLNGHSYTYETIKQETCTSTGERKYTCSVCGDEYAETVPAAEHPFTYTVAKPATCLSTGMGIYTCPDCGLQSTETIPKSGHSSVVIEVVPSEYDENGALISAGYTLYECTECGSQYTESEDVGVENESWFSWLGSLFKTFLSSIVNGLAAGLEWVIEEVLVTTVGWIIKVVEWVFGLFNGEHLTTLFNWFSFEHEAWANEFSDPALFKEVA